MGGVSFISPSQKKKKKNQTHIFYIFIISTWYQSHFLVAFNILVFPHIPSDNLNAQFHSHTPPKALCQFNIMHVTRQSDSVR
jgi:hypothetical protein